MNSKINLQVENISLRKFCQEQRQPYFQLSNGDALSSRTLKTVNGSIPVSFRSTAMCCGKLSNVFVFGRSYVSDGSARGVFDGQGHRDDYPKDYVRFYAKEFMNQNVTRQVIEEECCFVGGFTGENRYFGHFLFEFLYRLAAYDMVGVLDHMKVAVYDDVPDTWLSFLELYGVSKDKILKVPQHPAVQFKNVWVSSSPNHRSADKVYEFWDEGIMAVRRKVLSKVLDPGATGPKRVFIGRRDAKHRRLLNEDDVQKYLGTHGFESLMVAGRSAAEQVRLVASADIIVTVAGSASQITHFAPKDCLDLVKQTVDSVLSGQR